ncbi:MAG: hypothetical protein ACR2MK_02565, partial [Solirubrobacteraceae bacterium]
TWHQCRAGPVNDTVVTQGYGQGASTLHIGAWDAAGETVDYRKAIYIDNQQPSVTLSGPTDAPSTAGTQYVTATAAGPFGGGRDLVLGRRGPRPVVSGRERSGPGERCRPAFRAVLGGQQRS